MTAIEKRAGTSSVMHAVPEKGDKLVPHEYSGLRHSEEDHHRAELKRQYKSLGFWKTIADEVSIIV